MAGMGDWLFFFMWSFSHWNKENIEITVKYGTTKLQQKMFLLFGFAAVLQ